MRATERDFSATQRDKLAGQKKALPDGSFPIATRKDVENAVHAIGRAKDPAAAKRHIISRARALHCLDVIPNDWLTMAGREADLVEGLLATQRARHDVTGSAAEAVWSQDGSGVQKAEVVLVRPGMSKNGRFYTAEAIKKAVADGFWNGSKMFLDHGDARMPMVRSIRDLVAGIDRTWLGNEGEARGEVRFFSPEFAKFAQEAQKHIGVSISHDFAGRRFRDPATHQVHEQVDEFKRNHSVDWVAFPAAGGEATKFYRAVESEDDVDYKDLTPDLIRDKAPELYAEISRQALTSAQESDEPTDDPPVDEEPTPEVKPPVKAIAKPAAQPMVPLAEVQRIAQEQVQAALAERSQNEAKQADVRKQVVAKLTTANLPASTQARLAAQFDGSVEFVEATVQEAIDGAKAELAEAGAARPRVTDLGPSGAANGSADAATLPQRYPTMAAVMEGFGVSVTPPDNGKAN